MSIPPKINMQVIDINGVPVKMQSKPDNEAVNGWAVITYTPVMSLRSKTTYSSEKRDSYAHAIAIACGYGPWELEHPIAEADLDKLQLAIKQLTPTEIPEL
jgi:hypothetical protein